MQSDATQPNPTQAAARKLTDLGRSVCRIKSGEKKPTQRGWTKQSADPNDFQPNDNIGIMTGSTSDCNKPNHSLVCVDLDSELANKLADKYLPETAMMDGRASKPNSHHYYLIPNDSIPAGCVASGSAAVQAAIDSGRHPGPKTSHLKLPGGGIDFQGTGAQVVAPPSLHPTGELRGWHGGEMGEPAIIDYSELIAAVEQLATECGWKLKAPRPKALPAESKNVASPTVIATDTVIATGTTGTQSLTIGDIEHSLAERARRAESYIDGIPDADLSRTGNHGHDALYRIVRIIYNDFAVQNLDDVKRIVNKYNARLPENDRWTDSDIARKIEAAMSAPDDPQYPLGCKLAEPSDIPRSWKDPHRLAEVFGECHVMRFQKDTPYLYNPARGIYQTVCESTLNGMVRNVAQQEADAEFKRLIDKWDRFGETIDANDRQALTKHAKAKPLAAPEVSLVAVASAKQAIAGLNQLPDDFDVTAGTPGTPVVGNGNLDLNTRTLSPHNPKNFTLTALPVNYDPEAKCPKWLDYIADVTQGDAEKAAVLQEIAGATLDAHLQVKFFALLPGSGDNGKSVFLVSLRAVLGDGNVSSVGLEDLASQSNRFASFALMGKLANVVGDQGYFDSACEAKLKQLTGGDVCSFEQKGRDSIRGVNRAKMIFACNTLPSFSDKSDAVWNRAVIVPFDWTCPPGKKNPALLTPAYWDAELSGILNWMLEGLDRLRRNGRFSGCEDCVKAVDDLRADSNPAVEYLLERYETAGADSFVPTKTILENYKKWQGENGINRPLDSKTLKALMHQAFPNASPLLKRPAPPPPSGAQSTSYPPTPRLTPTRGYAGIAAQP